MTKKVNIPDTEVERPTGRKRQTLANDRSKRRVSLTSYAATLVCYDLEDLINFKEDRETKVGPI